MITSIATFARNILGSLTSGISRKPARGISLPLFSLAALAWAMLPTSASAQTVVYDTARLTSWAHVIVTVCAFIFAMKLAAAAFARPHLLLADIPTGPRYLTSPGYYTFGLVVFMLLTAFIFLVLIYLHKEVIAVVDVIHVPFLPEWLSKQIVDAVSNQTAPYLLIVFFMAALFLYLLHREAEWNLLLMLRDLIHIWIAIPARAGAIVAQTSVKLSVPERFVSEIVNGQVGVRREDFEKDAITFERLWAELSYIRLWLTRQIESGEAGFFNDGEFKLDELLAEYTTLAADVVKFRKRPQAHAADVKALAPRAKTLRRRLGRVVGCYLVHRYGVNDRLDHAAGEFGLPVEPTSNENPFKYIVIYLLTLAVCVYLGVYISAIAFDLLTGKSVETALSTQDDDLVWRWISFSTANYGLAISVVLIIRYIVWTSSAKASATYLWTYCWTALVAGLVGPLGLTTAVKLYQVARFADVSFISTFATELKWGVGPAILAVFISYYMDRRTSNALPDINQSRGSVGWRIAVSLLVALVTIVLLLPPLLALPKPAVGDWSREKLHAVAIGATFFIAFGLALAAQFALRKPQTSKASVPAVA